MKFIERLSGMKNPMLKGEAYEAITKFILA